jgi:hypothetical protein
MSERTDHPTLIEYLGANDAPCPRCAYNLRGCHTDCCPECGLEFSQIPVSYLATIHADAMLERRLVRIAMGCVLIVGLLPCLIAFATPILSARVLVVFLYLSVIGLCVYAERTTTTRHIRASRKSLYDGTTCFGTMSLLAIAILGFPTFLIVGSILLELADALL